MSIPQLVDVTLKPNATKKVPLSLETVTKNHKVLTEPFGWTEINGVRGKATTTKPRLYYCIVTLQMLFVATVSRYLFSKATLIQPLLHFNKQINKIPTQTLYSLKPKSFAKDESQEVRLRFC